MSDASNLPPYPDEGETIEVFLPPEILYEIDAWILERPEPRPSRAEAARKLIEYGLGKALVFVEIGPTRQ